MKKLPIWVLVLFLPIILTGQQKSESTILSIVKSQVKNELSSTEVNKLQLTVNDVHKSTKSKLEHYYFSQNFNGIDIHGTESSIHFKSDGSVFKFNDRLEKGLSTTAKTSQPSLNAIDAVMKAANHLGYNSVGKIGVLEHLKT